MGIESQWHEKAEKSEKLGIASSPKTLPPYQKTDHTGDQAVDNHIGNVIEIVGLGQLQNRHNSEAGVKRNYPDKPQAEPDVLDFAFFDVSERTNAPDRQKRNEKEQL